MFKAHLQRLNAAVDAHLGEPALWSGVGQPVQVHDEKKEDVVRYGDSEAIVEARVLRVQRDLVPAAAHGDTVTLTTTGEVLKVTGDPIADSEGYWACTVSAA